MLELAGTWTERQVGIWHERHPGANVLSTDGYQREFTRNEQHLLSCVYCRTSELVPPCHLCGKPFTEQLLDSDPEIRVMAILGHITHSWCKETDE